MAVFLKGFPYERLSDLENFRWSPIRLFVFVKSDRRAWRSDYKHFDTGRGENVRFFITFDPASPRRP